MNILRRAQGALKCVRAVNEKISEPKERRWQTQRGRPARKEPREERRIFEVIDGIIGDFQNAAEDLGTRNAPNGQTRLLDDFIGAALRLLGFGRVARHCVFVRSRLVQGRTQTTGELDDDAGVPASMHKEALFGRSEMIEELGPHLIADQRYRLAFEQTVSRRLQHVAQIVLRYVLSDHFVKQLAVTQRGFHGLLERIVDEPFAAQAQKSAMPDS